MDKLCKLSDEQLVKNYANGDSDAFDTLLARYQQKIYSYILFLVHDDEVADDLFQETFMKAIVTIRQGRYVESGRFSAWLTRIAHNLVIDKYRQDRNSNVISNDASDADLFNDVSLSDITVEMKMITEQSLTDVGRLLKELPDNQKEVLYMRFYQDLSFKEIADATGVSINTALGRMRYGLINLRKMVSERGIVLEVY
ncbi:MAG: sigma-70 family RNA polymerase sigma factor [Prevotellaceae bacterium]|nr:sigma-70 family RNA polymerase sigma factor [Bacteroidaceae bacterium]MCI6517998.1 sigma-70 family RNA polymerase sigma factor [Prevotellaceae bacterium]MDD7375933.1 sigma-70 family RNA polymerase sigma factor [Prevotellaceae bacterium]MDY4759621.1 sigma-70 family RNA polymerase sigma factor [Bacteroidaceae bacterium]